MRIHRLLPATALIGLLAGCAMPPAESAGSGPAAAQNPAAPATASDPGTAPSPAEFGLAGTSATSVGARAAQLGREVDRLDASAGSCSVTQADIKTQRGQLSTDYFTHVAQINARLQAGTTAGNPELVTAWQAARGALDSLDREAARLGDLVTSCTDDTAQATYLTESIRAAMSLRGAVDADRAELIRQSGRVGSISSSLELTLDLMLDDLNRQNEMLLVEHRNLTTLAHAIDVGQLLGGNLALRGTALPNWTAPIRSTAPVPLHHRHSVVVHQPAAPAADGAAPDATPAPADATTPPARPHKRHHHTAQGSGAQPILAHYHHHRPVIVIPLGGDGSYERALYSAVSTALNKQPDARFVVEPAVQRNPNRGRAVLDASAAHREADAVARSLASFGLPQARITTTGTVSGTGGIRVYEQ
jgi:hypothetical protein